MSTTAQLTLAKIRAAIATGAVADGSSTSATVGENTLTLEAARISQGFVPTDPEEEFFKDVETNGPKMNLDWATQEEFDLWSNTLNTQTSHFMDYEFSVRLWASFTRDKATDPTLIEALVETIRNNWIVMASGSNPPKTISFTPEVRPDLSPGVVCYTYKLKFASAFLNR